MKLNKIIRACENWGSVTNPDRRRAFLHNSLWIGFLPAVALGFGAVFVLSVCVGLEPAGLALRYGLLNAGLNAFGWIIGIWCSVGPEEKSEGESEEKPVANPIRRYAAGIGNVLLLACVIFLSEIMDLIDGSAVWPKTFIEMVSKAMTFACVVIPVGLSYRKR